MGKVKALSSEYKKRMIWAVCTAVFLIACIVTYAWINSSKQIYTYTHVERPTTLSIKGPNETTVEQIRLGTIDLGDSNKYSFVFCVTGSNASSYKIELAYTTNIPFLYRVIPTEQEEQEPQEDALVYTIGGANYYYQTGGTQLNGTFINKDDDGNYADDSKHADAYDTYDNVQKNAEPLYFLCDTISTGQSIGSFIHYYILELSIDDTVAAQYLKETDLVYILVSTN